jgi:hypothetical protein
MSPDNASGGTSFESESKISSEAKNIMGQVNKTEESGLATNCQIYRHPATPPASPEPSTPALQNGNQRDKMPLSSRLAKTLENALKGARPADS